VAVPKGKTRITIRIDDDILEYFRDRVDAAGTGNYQSMINSALRQFIDVGPAESALMSRLDEIEELIKAGPSSGRKTSGKRVFVEPHKGDRRIVHRDATRRSGGASARPRASAKAAKKK
jgi:hypothetical protein